MAFLDWLLQPKPKLGLNGQDIMARQAQMDNAPVGSVGAPGGQPLLPFQSPNYGRDLTTDILGLASFAPGIGDAAGLAADVRNMYMNPEQRTLGNAALTGLGMLPFVPGMTVFHGSPHKFDAFDFSKIGTGEGAQAYGHGLYFAENPGVAKSYQSMHAEPKVVIRDGGSSNKILSDGSMHQDMAAELVRQIALESGPDAAIDETISLMRAQANKMNQAFQQNEGRMPMLDYDTMLSYRDGADWLEGIKKAGAKVEAYTENPGAFYTVDLPDEHIDKMLDWDAPLSEQPALMKALDSAGIPTGPREQLYEIQENGEKFAIVDKRRGQYLPVEFRTREEAEKQVQAFRDNAAGEWKKHDSGMAAYTALADVVGQADASAYLKEAGIPGIKYYDQGSRANGGTRNFVVFDDKLVKILKRE